MRSEILLALGFALMPSVGLADVTVTSVHITQGIESQLLGDAAFPYDLVAGKDTLVRTTVNSGSETLTAGTCELLSSDRPRTYPAQLRRTDTSPGADLTFELTCWIPGDDIQAGGYDVALAATGARPYTLSLASGVTFQGTQDLRLLVAGYIMPPGHPDYRAYSDTYTINIAEEMYGLQRRYPLRRGVGNFVLAPATHSTGGLRYYLALPFEPCELRGSESINDAWTRCDSKARAEADLIMRLYNGALESRVPTRGIEPDRFDLALVLTPVPGPPGGQSCHGGQRSTGAGIGERLGDGSASTAGQEMAHCLGEVHSGSPSWDHGAHSTNFTIALPAGVKAVNMRTQQDVDTPESMMWPVALGNESGFFEAFEWNDVRAAITSGRGLLARSDSVHRQVLAAANAVQPQSQTRTPMFAIMGTVNRSGKLAMEYSGMVEPLHPHAATADETSDYAVAFFDKAGKLLAKHGFKPNFDSTHGKPRNVAGLSLLYAAPQGTRTVRVQRKGATLYQATCDQAAPAISRFEVGAGRNDERSVTWTAKSRAGRKLFYRLAFGRDQKQFPITTAIGVPATRWTLPERFMPAADNASVTLYASDGCNVASARRDQVKIPARAPVVAITSMQPLPGGGIRVVAVAYDYTDGLLTGSALQWSVDGRPAGSGEAIDVITRPEDRHVSVTAMNAARLEGHATVDIPLGR